MVLYTEADFDVINQQINKANSSSHGHMGDAQKKAYDAINQSGCQGSSFNALVEAVHDLAKIQTDKYNKRSKEIYEEKKIKERNQAKMTVNGYLNTLIIENNKTKNMLNTLISEYTTERFYADNMHELHSKHMNDVDKLKKEIDDYIGYVQVDNRKSFYENQETVFSDKILFYIKIVYYLLLVVYLFYGGFLQNKLYKNYLVVLLILVYISVPFILKYLVVYIFYFWDKFYYGFINTSDYNKEWFIKRH